jgi:hypothetical protein
MEELEARWSAAHAASLPLVRGLVASPPPPASAAATRLPPGTLDGATLALTLAREAAARRAPVEELASVLDEMEAILEEMHELARHARDAVAALPLDAAAARTSSATRSPTEAAIVAAAPLRCYEAELALKRWVTDALQGSVPPPEAQVQALLVAWQCQPMLEPVDAMRQGMRMRPHRASDEGTAAALVEPRTPMTPARTE